jgi:hypothetical protein
MPVVSLLSGSTAMPQIRQSFASLSLASICLIECIAFSVQTYAAEFMFRGTVDGKTFEGKPLAWTDNVMYLLGRDGEQHIFNPRDVKDAEKTSPHFYGYTVPEMKRELYGELGNTLEITTTDHYIVIHPRGEGGEWAKRFEALYSSFMHYFRVRGFQIEEPKFPLVAIAYHNQDEYMRAAKASGQNVNENVLGHYDPITNRVLLFDTTAGNSGSDWSTNADTIIHEATHQTAFNVGIHNRFADQPKWLVEGLATMFEAPGVWNSQSFHTLKDRINKERLADFRTKLPNRKQGSFGNLVASDQLFQSDAQAAYAEAWAMMLFLCETRPKQMGEYMERVANRADFSQYFATDRVNDFAASFGSDFKQLEANYLNWVAKL